MRLYLSGPLASERRVPVSRDGASGAVTEALRATNRGADSRMQTCRHSSRTHAAQALVGATETVGSAAQKDVLVPISDLRNLVRESVRSEGHSDGDADIITDVLLWAQLRGNNQGLLKLSSGAVAPSPGAKATETLLDRGSIAVLNGNQAYGMVVLLEATEDAIRKARAGGIGIVGTQQTSSSTGALGYFAEKIAETGLVGIVIAQSPEYVAPHGATEAIFGTNPVAVGIPAGKGHDPILFDMSTAAMAWYGLVEAKANRELVDDDVGFDAAGNVATDPAEILEGGAIRNFTRELVAHVPVKRLPNLTRDHKGSGLAFVLEVLSGALVGGAVEDKQLSRNWGCLVAAVDPAAFGSSEGFTKRVRQLVKRVKGARKEPGVKQVLLPGERGYVEAGNHALAMMRMSPFASSIKLAVHSG